MAIFILLLITAFFAYLIYKMLAQKSLKILGNSYVRIILATLVPYMIFALVNIPFFGDREAYGTIYFINIRTMILALHYIRDVTFFSLYCFLRTSKNVKMRWIIIPAVAIHIVLFIAVYPISGFLWWAI